MTNPKQEFLSKALSIFKQLVDSGECSSQDINYWCGVSDYEMERRGVSVGRKWLSKKEASALIGISRSTFDRIVAQGGLPRGKKIVVGDKRLYWSREEIEQLKRLVLLKRKC